jgi:hypothetical protein
VSSVSIIADHRFKAPPDEPWGRCVVEVASMGDWLSSESPAMEPCGLAESAHEQAFGRYPRAESYRCPWCVSTGAETCEHEGHPLGMDGAPLGVAVTPEPAILGKPEPVVVSKPVLPEEEYRPVATGTACTRCGGLMVRTGSCETCVECGENTGCG